MKIIEFPTKRISKLPSKVIDKSFEGDIIDISFIARHGSDANSIDFETSDEFLKLDHDQPSDSGPEILERIVKTAKEICADEKEMSTAICAVIEELVRKTAPLKEKCFLPNAAFFKMIDNDVYEARFSEMLQLVPRLYDYKELTLTQLVVMLDKNWPFQADEKILIDFILHMLGAAGPVDLLKLKSYVSENDWSAVIKIMSDS